MVWDDGRCVHTECLGKAIDNEDGDWKEWNDQAIEWSLGRSSY
jgi:hypothetical protein